VRRRAAAALRLGAALLCSVAAVDARAADALPDELARGQALFDLRCGICHAAGGTGAFMLGRRLGTDNALLAQRTNLTADYVEYVVRRGINSMPVFTRVELTDAELALVVAYLTRRAAAP
jgi:mono/diheme cytochrome c family protein